MRSGSRPRARLVGPVLAAAVALTAAGCAASQGGGDEGARPGRLVRLPDGRRINLRCAGAGSPTVVLEGGFAADSMAWRQVQPAVARHTRACACAYDRAGYGFSDRGPEPRDGAAVAADLDAALRAGGVKGPLVLVGHSAGGLYARLFAARRPHDVVGMVLVDPSAPYQDRRFAAVFGPGAGGLDRLQARAARCLGAAQAGALPSRDPALVACGPSAKPGESRAVVARRTALLRRPAYWRTQISELNTLWSDTSREVEAGPRDLGDLPLIVLTADGTYGPPSSDGVSPPEALWARLHDEMAALSSRGQSRMVTGSSHMMMFDRPDVIAAAVDTVISVARERAR